MRSKPKNPNKGKVALVLAILALIWLALGTLLIFGFRQYMIDHTLAAQSGPAEVEEDQDAGQEAQEEVQDDDDDSDMDDFDDPDQDLDKDLTDDYGDLDYNDGSDDEDDLDDDDEDSDDKDDDDDGADDDEQDDTKTFTINAWDGFAAVRTGRGTSYNQVGRLNNGEKVTVTDLENGWYKIASGKWKGYYLHESSLK